MTNIVLTLTCFITLTTVCSAYDAKTLKDGYDYSLNTSKTQTLLDSVRDKNCSTPGHMCKNCTTRVNCVLNSNGALIETGHHTCLDEETCKTTECVEGRNPPCEDVGKLKFVCLDIGMFPDQFNCQRLHMCAPGTDGNLINFTIECGGKFVYNPLTTYCDIPLQNDGSCYPAGRQPEWPAPACEDEGQLGAIVDNKSIYYTCEKYEKTGILYPFLRVCANGGQFNDQTMTCDPKESFRLPSCMSFEY